MRTLLTLATPAPRKILDLGCGYGPIGIVLAKQHPLAEVHFVDRDALALEYAQQNVELNQIQGPTRFYASLGFDSVTDTDFDLIVSNVPAKVGPKVLAHFLIAAQHHLSPGGQVAIVVVDVINNNVQQLLAENEKIEIQLHKSWPGHHVYHYTFLSPPSSDSCSTFESGIYKRSKQHFHWNHENFQLTTTYHLKEFNQLGFETQLLLEQLQQLPSSCPIVAVMNPGQGFIPTAVTAQCHPEKLILIDRDLQALQVSRQNVMANEFPPDHVVLHHQVDWSIKERDGSAFIGIIPEKQNLEVYEMLHQQAYEMLAEGGKLVLSSSATTLHRLEQINKKQKHFNVVSRAKNKGASCVVLSKR